MSRYTHDMLRAWGEALDKEIPNGTGETLLCYADDWRYELEAMRKDAERYRWLQYRTGGFKDNEGRQYFSFPSRFGLPPVTNIMQGSVGQHLNAAIDEAIKVDGSPPLPR